jgi:hypothetical protein
MDQTSQDKYFRMMIALSIIFAVLLVGLFIWSFFNLKDLFITKERFQRLGDRVGNLESSFEEEKINIDTRLDGVYDKIKDLE